MEMVKLIYLARKTIDMRQNIVEFLHNVASTLINGMQYTKPVTDL